LNTFQLHRSIVSDDYAECIRSLIDIEDGLKLRRHSNVENFGRSHWFISIRATRSLGASMSRLRPGPLTARLQHVFKDYSLYQHQIKAITLATSGQDFIVTSGPDQENRSPTSLRFSTTSSGMEAAKESRPFWSIR
jgi:hypothetical protein